MITEWIWLGVLLRLVAVEGRSEMYSTAYTLEELPRRFLRCHVWAAHTSTMVAEKASRREQLEYYRGWVQMEKDRVRKCLSDLPGLRKSFRFQRDFVVEILDHYGMGSALVCTHSDGKFHWRDDRSKLSRSSAVDKTQQWWERRFP
jgi:hypothetical protein